MESDSFLLVRRRLFTLGLELSMASPFLGKAARLHSRVFVPIGCLLPIFVSMTFQAPVPLTPGMIILHFVLLSSEVFSVRPYSESGSVMRRHYSNLSSR